MSVSTSNFSSPTKICLIGLGHQGLKHAQALATLERSGLVQVMGVCDLRDSALQQVPAAWPKYYRYQRMLQTAGAEVAVVAAANAVHYEASLMALQSGHHLLKEKPLALTLAEANRLVAVAGQRQRHLLVFQQRWFHPAFQAMAKLLPLVQTAATPQEAIQFQYRLAVNDQKPSWYWQSQAGGGVWLNLAWHQLDVLHGLFGSLQLIQCQQLTDQRQRPWDYDTDHSVVARWSSGYESKIPIRGVSYTSCVDRAQEMLRFEVGLQRLRLEKNPATGYQVTLNGQALSLKKTISSDQYLDQLASFVRLTRTPVEATQPLTNQAVAVQKLLQVESSTNTQKGNHDHCSHQKSA